MNTEASLDTFPGSSAGGGSGSAGTLMLRVELGMDGLTRLRDDWNRLAQALPDGRFHHQYAWYLSYLRHLEEDPASVRFFSFFRGNRPAAIFPLRWTMGTVAGMSLRLWELPYHHHMDLCDALIASDEDGAALIRQLLEALRHQSGACPWDALHLPKLLDSASALGALRAAALPRVRIVPSGQSMHLQCADIDTAMRNASKDFKRNLRRQRRKLEQHGRVAVSLVQDAEALEGAFSELLEVEASGWKGDGGRGSAIALHGHLTDFYRDIVAERGAETRCSINLLKLDGKAIAAQYCLICGKRANLLKIAYDEAFSAEAPGQQLLLEVLAHCCASPSIDELSLVTGPKWAIGRWNPESQGIWTAQLFNTTLRGLAAYTLLRLKDVSAKARTADSPNASNPKDVK
jgi:CelD/BcsL family acetyltransferase involved in cellulose biosynthesis